MTTEAGGFTDFMSQKVGVKRSYLYILRFLFLFSFGNVLEIKLGPGLTSRSFASALGIAFFLSIIFYVKERYGQPSDRTRIVFSLLVLAILGVVIWHHETNMPDFSRPYMPDSPTRSANQPR
jgi:hypothetical protein